MLSASVTKTEDTLMPDAESLVTVATFGTLSQAELARGHLDAEGIRSFVLDGESVNMDLFLSGAVGGVKLQVAKVDFLAAERLLNSREGKIGEGLDDYGLAKSTAITREPDIVRQEPDPRRTPSRPSGITADPDAVRDDATESDDDRDENEAEALVRTARRAAMLGVVVFPPILSVYSLWLLGCVKELDKPLREDYQSMFRFTAILDGVVVLVALAVVAALFMGGCRQ
jgi:hypothetical protein